MATMREIEAKALEFSQARAALAEVCRVFQAEIELVKRRHMLALKMSVGEAKGKHADLCALIVESPALFNKPRSVVLHGVKLGYQKGKGKMVIEDEVKTIALIRKHLEDQAEILIATEEHPSKKALEQLAAADLKKIGVIVSETGDVVFAKDTAADVDKIVAAFLKDDVEEVATPELQRAAA